MWIGGLGLVVVDLWHSNIVSFKQLAKYTDSPIHIECMKIFHSVWFKEFHL